MIHKVRKNLYLIITSVVFGLSVIFAAAIFISLEVEGELNRTSVGFIYLGDKSENQYGTILTSEISKWKNQAKYVVYFQEYTYELDMDYFEFNQTRTLSLLKKNLNNRAYFEVSETNNLLLEQDMRFNFSDLLMDSFDFSQFLSDVRTDMQLLYILKEYQLEKYLTVEISESVINFTQITNVDLLDTNTILEAASEIIIPKNKRFSLLQALSNQTLNNRQLSIIASGIQGVVGASSMSGFAYEQNRELPIWGVRGQNVRILQVNKYDFTFFNHLNYDLKITIERINDQTLEFKLIGYPFVTQYEVVEVELMVIPFPTFTYQNNEIVNHPDVEVIDLETETLYRLKVQEGVNGIVIYFYREITRLNEDTITTLIYDEQYVPTPEIYYEYREAKEDVENGS